MIAQMTLAVNPVTFTEPSSSTRFYFTPTLAFINGAVDVVVAYSDPDQGNTNLQPQTFVGYVITPGGGVSQNSEFVNWINATNPQTIPASTLNYQIKAFNGSSSGSVFGEYFDTINANGTATFTVAAVNASAGNVVVNEVPDTITVTPVPKNLTDNITADLANAAQDSSPNEQIFEVEGAPNAGETRGTFLIFNSNGAVVVGPTTGFDFTDGKAHVFAVGPTGFGSSSFIEAVEVWNSSTGLADVQISSIDANGAVSVQGIVPAEVGSITRLSFQYIGSSPNATGVVAVGAGTNAAGIRGFEEIVTPTVPTNGTFAIEQSQFIAYSGTVTQDARIDPSGIGGEYVVDWVDGDGLTVELINSSLQVLETYNFANANGTATLTPIGNGELYVDYRVQSPTSAVDDFAILNAAPAPSNPVNIDEWILSDGQWEASAGPGSHPSGYNLAAVGDWTGDGTDGILWYNPSTGDTDEWQLSNTQWAASVDLGTHPGNYQISGVGDFSGNGIDDVLWTSASGSSVQTDIWELGSNGQWEASVSPGSHPAGYTVAGIGDWTGNGTDGVLWYNPSTGDTDEWQLANGQWAASVDLGTHPGTGWQIAGVGDFTGDGIDDVLWTNSSNGQVQTDIWELGSNGQWIDSVSPGTHPAGYQVVGVGDFTGNGTSDILWQNSTTGDVDEWLIKNGQWAGSVDLGTHPGSYQIAGVGDFNGSGTSGVLWHSTS